MKLSVLKVLQRLLLIAKDLLCVAILFAENAATVFLHIESELPGLSCPAKLAGDIAKLSASCGRCSEAEQLKHRELKAGAPAPTRAGELLSVSEAEGE